MCETSDFSDFLPRDVVKGQTNTSPYLTPGNE